MMYFILRQYYFITSSNVNVLSVNTNDDAFENGAAVSLKHFQSVDS